MKGKFIQGILAFLLFGGSSFAWSEDIDLFVDKEKDSTDRPTVLLVLDNAANFSASAAFATCPGESGWPTAMANTVGGIEQCALYKVVDSLKVGSVNLGIMLFNENNFSPRTGSQCVGSDGGCLVFSASELTAARKEEIKAWVKGWKTSGQSNANSFNVKTNNKKNGSVMQEAWAYLSGRKGLSGRDYEGVSPAASCANKYVIFVGNAYGTNGQPGEGGSANPKLALEGGYSGGDVRMNAWPSATDVQRKEIKGPVPVDCGVNDSFTFSNNHLTNGYYADEWSQYMYSQGVKTYSVGILGASCQPSYEALLKSMGEGVGGGKYFPTNNYEELKTALDEALTEIQSVNSVFASVSLPVSVNTQGTYLNQVFIGMFRPGENARPRWHGNLKQYKLGYDESRTLKLLDADDESAISRGDTGFVAECARSFWTPKKSNSSTSLYWANISEENCPTYSEKSETPDGNMVEKGGQGYKLRNLGVNETPVQRNVLTCDNTIVATINADGTTTTTGAACETALSNFNKNNEDITVAALKIDQGTALEKAAEREELIAWARGENLDAEPIVNSTPDASGNIANFAPEVAKTMMRPSSHGDVVHSRPVAINYASSGTAQVVVFYGGNDGMLRAVNGNRDDGGSIGDKAPGEELWSFVAPESYGMLKRLRENSPLIKYPTVNVAGAKPKDYGFDGPVAAYKDGSNAWLYATMRRGGRMLYAFDVSTPQTPSLKWRVGCNDAGCTSPSFDKMGQTWAVPIAMKAAGYTNLAGVHKPMLIMGGGYDVCEDTDPATCSTSAKGHAVYLLDADSGDLLKTFNTDGGVVGDITLVKDDQGLVKYAYAADLSGNVYRIHATVCDADDACTVHPLGDAAPGNWNMTRIARLGGSGNAARKFMFGPDVVVDGDTHYLLLGSGDREKPLASFTNAGAVQNYFFMIKDQPQTATWLSSESTNCGEAVMCLNSLYGIVTAATPSSTVLEDKKGWYLQLDSSEKVVTSGLTIFGTVYFSTHQPDTATDSTNTCKADLGDSRSYSINFKNAEGLNGKRYADLVGDGLPPSPVAGLVTLDDGTTVPFCIGCDPESPLEGGEPPMPPSATQPKARVFWNIEQ